MQTGINILQEKAGDFGSAYFYILWKILLSWNKDFLRFWLKKLPFVHMVMKVKVQDLTGRRIKEHVMVHPKELISSC